MAVSAVERFFLPVSITSVNSFTLFTIKDCKFLAYTPMSGLSLSSNLIFGFFARRSLISSLYISRYDALTRYYLVALSDWAILENTVSNDLGSSPFSD